MVTVGGERGVGGAEKGEGTRRERGNKKRGEEGIDRERGGASDRDADPCEAALPPS